MLSVDHSRVCQSRDSRVLWINQLTVTLVLALCTSCMVGCAGDKALESYRYEQTRELVAFVEEAAEYFHAKGEEALPEFAHEGSKWFEGDRYIFIYDLDGTNVFHAVERRFQGKNLTDIEDINGRPVARLAIDIAKNEDKPYGWIHYYWVEPGQIEPMWKSAYIVRVEDPSGKPYLLGSGLYNMKTEPQFVVDVVDSAAELIESEGEAAFDALRTTSSEYNFADSFIFVISMNGTAIVDPGYPTIAGRDLLNYTDAVGEYMVRDMIEALKTEDSAWVMFMERKENEPNPSTKLAYVRKAELEDETIIVGSSFFVENPIWMKC
jgi:signal transduction histidine kinase